MWKAPDGDRSNVFPEAVTVSLTDFCAGSPKDPLNSSRADILELLWISLLD